MFFNYSVHFIANLSPEKKFDVDNRTASLLGRAVKTISKVVKSFTDSQLEFSNDPCALMEALSPTKNVTLVAKVPEFLEIKKQIV